MQLYDQWYVREDKWKLTQAGELFDMKDAPFTEPLVPTDSTDEAAAAARTRLQAVLDKLNPTAGKRLPEVAPQNGKGAAKRKGGARRGRK